jgi:hypothetical protein
MADQAPWYLARPVPFVTSFGALLVYFSAKSSVMYLTGAVDHLTAKVIVLIWLHLHLVTALGAWSGFSRFLETRDKVSLAGGILNLIHFSVFAFFWARFVLVQFTS